MWSEVTTAFPCRKPAGGRGSLAGLKEAGSPDWARSENPPGLWALPACPLGSSRASSYCSCAPCPDLTLGVGPPLHGGPIHCISVSSRPHLCARGWCPPPQQASSPPEEVPEPETAWGLGQGHGALLQVWGCTGPPSLPLPQLLCGEPGEAAWPRLEPGGCWQLAGSKAAGSRKVEPSLQNSFLQGHRCGSGNVFQSPPKPETRCSAETGMPSQPQEAMSLRRVGGSRAAVPRGYPGKSQLCLGQDPEVQPARAGGNGMVTPNQGSQGQQPQTWHCTQRPSGEAGRSGESPRQNEG